MTHVRCVHVYMEKRMYACKLYAYMRRMYACILYAYMRPWPVAIVDDRSVGCIVIHAAAMLLLLLLLLILLLLQLLQLLLLPLRLP